MPRGPVRRRQRTVPGGGQDEFQSALAYAFKLLGYRQRSERELARRLAMKGYGAEAASRVLEKLRDSGYIDDRITAGSLRLRAEETRLLGLGGARMYLRNMGISEGDAEEALAGYDEAAGAARLVEKKQRSLLECPPEVARQRLAGYLRRRGFSYETVRRTIKEFFEEEDR